MAAKLKRYAGQTQEMRWLSADVGYWDMGIGRCGNIGIWGQGDQGTLGCGDMEMR